MKYSLLSSLTGHGFILKKQNEVIFLLLCITKFANADDLNKAYKSLEKGDYKTAIYFLSYFANLGNARAQYNYAIMLKKGLGTKLINKIEENNSYLKKIYLEVAKNNSDAISFYKKMKFKIIYKRKKYFFIENKKIDALAMTKIF